MKKLTLLIITNILLICSCKQQDINPENTITNENISKHIERLASDAFLGRKPGTKGEHKTVNYIKNQLEDLNISPGNNSSYFQEFTIQKVNFLNCSNLEIVSENSKNIYTHSKDFYANTSFELDKIVKIDTTEIVFAGFGITASNQNWDDYKDIDVHGKIVIVLYNDPGFYTNDPKLFRGKQPTYYGSLKYKKREALKRGAIGLLMVHDKSLDWNKINNTSDTPLFIKGQETLASDGLKFSGQISIPMMEDLIASSGNQFNYINKALDKDFSIIPLKSKASLSLKSTGKEVMKTKNVVGLLKGSKRPKEYLIYTAHWDHIGTRDAHLGQDSIFNGAIDNASGTAMQLEVARAFSKLKNKPERSIIFLFTSAEEMGLLGSEYYANHPIFPLHKTACVINADASFAVERMKMVVNVIEGFTELDTLVNIAAAKLDRAIFKGDGKMPPNNVFKRSDHYPFVKKGVPAVWNIGNFEPMNGDKKEEEKIGAYVRNHYHKVTDEFYKGFNPANITFDAQLNFLTGLEIANTTTWPNWNLNSGYRLIRDESISKETY
ncbi:M20/M25/M40 family metallo-hydrolase [uncultured Psychroserpens sp.]|uniref:M20/M25/M40 family metallo-hydrolase n=1 Tax=uncultured Psychroserpens sp. TaxID=255436 RepID=UPI0026299678|nr:M20/M25/M40 family metallo-hydrolase [uncultured Psychroserpens sp.]